MANGIQTDERVKAFAWRALREAVPAGNYTTNTTAGAYGVASFAKKLGELLAADGHLDPSFGESGSYESELAARAVASFDGGARPESMTPAFAYARAVKLAKELAADGLLGESEINRLRTPSLERERSEADKTAKAKAEAEKAERKASALAAVRVKLGINNGKEVL